MSRVTIKKAGTPVRFEAEVARRGDEYWIGSRAHEVWDRNVPVKAFVDGHAVSVADVDPLFGRVRLDDNTPKKVTLRGCYVPLVEVANASEYRLEHGSTRTGRRLIPTTRLEVMDVKLRSDGALDVLYGDDPFVVEIWPRGGRDTFRGWFVLAEENPESRFAYKFRPHALCGFSYGWHTARA